MRDPHNPRLMWLKALLFVLIGLTGATLLWLQAPPLLNPVLLLLVIWAFCRACYFANLKPLLSN